MSKPSEMDEQQLIECVKSEFNRIDSAYRKETGPSLAAFEALASQTQLRLRRKNRREFAIFLVIASFLVSGMLLAWWNQPELLLLIHGMSMLIGVVVLIMNLRSRERRDIHE